MCEIRVLSQNQFWVLENPSKAEINLKLILIMLFNISYLSWNGMNGVSGIILCYGGGGSLRSSPPPFHKKINGTGISRIYVLIVTYPAGCPIYISLPNL